MVGKPQKLPPLAALRVFEAAGRNLNFVRAANELGVTPSAVSHGIRTLEDSLGIQLVRRDVRPMSLTPAGEDLLSEATRAFGGIARAVERLTDARGRAGLRVSCAPTFAAKWLLPRLGKLRRDHPGLSVSISTEQDWVDFGDGRFDCAIRMASEAAGAGDWCRLCDIELAPVAAARFAGMSTAAVLARIPAIHVTSSREDWAAWAAAEDALPDVTKGLRVDTVHMAMDAAAQGLGVALARLPICQSDIDEGRVVLLAAPRLIQLSYWLVTRPGLLRQTSGRLFASWLVAALSRE